MDQTLMRETVEAFQEKLAPLELQVNTINGAISAIQKACAHPNRVETGHGGHNNETHYDCPDCKKAWWV